MGTVEVGHILTGIPVKDQGIFKLEGEKNVGKIIQVRNPLRSLTAASCLGVSFCLPFECPSTRVHIWMS